MWSTQTTPRSAARHDSRELIFSKKNKINLRLQKTFGAAVWLVSTSMESRVERAEKEILEKPLPSFKSPVSNQFGFPTDDGAQ